MYIIITWRYDWSSQLYMQLKKLWNLSLKKFRPEQDLNPWPLRCCCCALPNENWSRDFFRLRFHSCLKLRVLLQWSVIRSFPAFQNTWSYVLLYLIICFTSSVYQLCCFPISQPITSQVISPLENVQEAKCQRIAHAFRSLLVTE